MSDRELWLLVRRALLMIVKAIEGRYLKEPIRDAKWVETHLTTHGESDSK